MVMSVVNSDPGRRYQRHREKVKWVYLLVNFHINFPAYAEALIHEHYGDSHDRLAGFTNGMNDDREKHDREHACAGNSSAPSATPHGPASLYASAPRS